MQSTPAAKEECKVNKFILASRQFERNTFYNQKYIVL